MDVRFGIHTQGFTRILTTSKMETTYFSDERNVTGSKDKEHAIHYLPCKISQSGPANIGSRFVDTIRTNPDNEEVKETEFRSRPLKGSLVKLPENYKGIVVTSSPTLSPPKIKQGNEGKTLVIKQDFNSLVNWNWDKLPSSMDSLAKANDWLQLAASLHDTEPQQE